MIKRALSLLALVFACAESPSMADAAPTARRTSGLVTELRTVTMTGGELAVAWTSSLAACHVGSPWQDD